MPNPTKKQRELLNYIEDFLASNGYSPSYREIKRGLSYGSIGTVAHHVDHLVTLGLLRKREKSARSLEPVATENTVNNKKQSSAASEKWLVDSIDAHFRFVENNPNRSQKHIDELQILIASLRILDLEAASKAFQTRIKKF